MIECSNWCGASPDVVTPLLTREAQMWRTRFGWDLVRDWAGLEEARVQGRVPGVLARNVPDRTGQTRPRRAHRAGLADRVNGWAFHLDSAGTRMVGALVADAEAVTRALVRAVLAGDCPDAVLVFVRDAAPGLSGVLSEQGFRVEGYTLLSKRVGAEYQEDAEEETELIGRSWRSSDLVPCATLLREAYEQETPLRPFAPGGQPAEWHDYVVGLTERPGCGVFAPHLSVIVPGPGGDQGEPALDGLVLTTVIGPGVAQLAQVATAPRARGQRLGTRMLARACRLAAADGCQQVTLLVADTNLKARQLYRAAGFTPAGAFVAAERSTLAVHQHCA